MSTSEISDSARLRDMIDAAFDLEELRDLCQDLKVDFDNLPGESKQRKAGVLVDRVARAGRIDALLNRMLELRPHLTQLEELCHSPELRPAAGDRQGAATREQAEQRDDIFVSFAAADREWVEGYLLDALKQAGLRCHSEEAFELGTPRVAAFREAMTRSRCSLLVLSPEYLGADFERFTGVMDQAYGLETAGWPIIPLVLKPVDLPARLEPLTSLDATRPENWPGIVERLCAGLQRSAPGPAPPPECPYPGMTPFREEDSARFFGRDQEVGELLEWLRLHPFRAIIGPSGSGKSSLVFAGLIPALRRSTFFGSSEWEIHTLRPGAKPMAAFKELFGNADFMVNRMEEMDGVDRSDLSTLSIPSISSILSSGTRLLLVVDQFEEVFTQGGPEAIPFQELLLQLAEISGCYLVLTVRADFYPELMAGPLWGIIQALRTEVTPLREDGLRQAIIKPAAAAGVFVETALVERLLAEAAGEPGALPLIQETLVLLWQHLERRFLPLSAYEQIVLRRSATGGTDLTGLQVAMARRADVVLAGLGSESQRVIARRIFLRLIQFGEGRDDIRRQQTVAALRSADDDPRLFDRTLEHLTTHRLLTRSFEVRSTEQQDEAAGRKVDISHESLINGWPQLQNWVAERREAEQTRRRLTAQAAEWVRMGCGAGGLLDKDELPEAERWLNSQDAADLGYDAALADLVHASRARQRRNRIIQFSAISLIILSIMTALGIGLWSAQREKRLFYSYTAQSLAANGQREQALIRFEGEVSIRGALLARQAYLFNQQFQRQTLSEVRDALLTVLHRAPDDDTPAHTLVEQVCQKVWRNLTQTEWDLFARGFPYARTCPDLPLHFSVLEEVRRLAEDGRRDFALRWLEHLQQLDPGLPLDSKTGLPLIRLRSEPQIVSSDQARQVFDLNDNWYPNMYISNNFETQGDVVLDHATGLMWQQSGSGTSLIYAEAEVYITILNREQFAGFNDWRLPTIPELLSLLEPEQQSNDLYINPVFGAERWWCWSADKRLIEGGSSAAAWLVRFSLGDVDWSLLVDRNAGTYVRAVRS